LMDEPFGALDTNTRLKMQDFVLGLWNKITPTIFLVTHDINEAVYLGDDIYIMSSNPGEIVESIHSTLPKNRTKDIKRTKEFTDMVFYIENKMSELNN